MSSIKGRLSAVSNIQQITRSMELIASVRFRKMHVLAKHAENYRSKIEELVTQTTDALKESNHPLFLQNKTKTIAAVIVAADKGLCGGYNAALLKQAELFLKNHDAAHLYLIGKKTFGFFGKKRWPIKLQCQADKVDLPLISDQIVQEFLAGNLGTIFLIYTRFISLTESKVVIEPFLPIHSDVSTKKSFIFEPTAIQFAEALASRYLRAKLTSMHYSALSSELAARIFAMKAASKNAEEMMEELTLANHKIRQAAITREILETTYESISKA